LICDCDIFWLWDATHPSDDSLKSFNFDLTAACTYPAKLNGLNLTSLMKSDFECGNNTRLLISSIQLNDLNLIILKSKTNYQ
jgi:hypothetical protein